MKRDEVYWGRPDPVEGSETGKTRPCVIVSDDLRNRILQTVVVCPLTTVLRPHWRTRLQVTGAGRKADACADRIRVVHACAAGQSLSRRTMKSVLHLTLHRE